jgi:hypothetical protein
MTNDPNVLWPRVHPELKAAVEASDSSTACLFLIMKEGPGETSPEHPLHIAILAVAAKFHPLASAKA